MCCEGYDLNSLLRPELEHAYRYHGQLAEIVEVGVANWGENFEGEAFRNTHTSSPSNEGLNF